MRRARAASSPLPHACKRFVISAVRASMYFPSPAHPTRELQEYTKTVAGFGGLLSPVPADGEKCRIMISLQKAENKMKYLTTMALMLNLGVASVYAQQSPVRMTFSGNGAPNAIDLKHPGTNTAEENVAGIGTLGSFTFRDLRAAATVPQPSSTCAGLFFPSVAGGGIFRFQDGSLLTVVLTGGGDCIDLVHRMA